MMAKYLNLGCGNRFHPTWTNINFSSTGDGVIVYNLTQGIPFPDRSFDVVYHSHLLEHFTKQEAESFLKECFRVLRPQGVLRVVVPDLEQIVRLYLFALKKASFCSEEWAANYEWLLLEMFDQIARNYSQGEMGSYLINERILNEEFVINRCGVEIKNLIDSGRQSRQKTPSQLPESRLKNSFKEIYRFFRYPHSRRETLLKIILGKEYDALQVGRFRQSGEVHQWMYDQYSLGLLLKKCGFKNIVKRTATESYITDWTCFDLDTEPNGTVYKPDSLFMEAIEPAT